MKKVKLFYFLLLLFIVFATPIILQFEKPLTVNFFRISVSNISAQYVISVLKVANSNISVKEANKTPLVSIVTIYSNISKNLYFVVTKNNSILYVKTHIFIIAHKSCIIRYNNVYNLSADGSLMLKANSNVRKLVVICNSSVCSVYYIIIRYINTLKEVEEIEEEVETVTVTKGYLMRLAVAGIPAFITAFFVALAVIVVKRDIIDVEEGFE